jgi:hypothetical protein
MLGAGLVVALVAGISLPNAGAASVHPKASGAHHLGSAACTAATGTSMIGRAAHAAGPNGGGVISGTITLASFTACGTATAGSFSASWAPPRPLAEEPADSTSTGSDDQDGTHGNSQAGTHGKGKGNGGGGNGNAIHGTTPVIGTTTISGTNVLSPTLTISSTSVLSATGTFVQDPAQPTNAAAVLVSGSATIGQRGSACRTACPAAATVPLSQTMTFSNVSGRLTVHSTGKSTKTTLMFIVPLSSQAGTQGHGSKGRPVHLMGVRPR